MKYGLYCIYDEKAKVYTEPYAQTNDPAAMRNFANQVNHNDLMKDNRSDFELYRVGYFDNEIGSISYGRDLICSAKDVIYNE